VEMCRNLTELCNALVPHSIQTVNNVNYFDANSSIFKKGSLLSDTRFALMFLMQITQRRITHDSHLLSFSQNVLFPKVNDTPETCCGVCMFKEDKLKKGEESSTLYIAVYT
jgi:hypothetical protein